MFTSPFPLPTCLLLANVFFSLHLDIWLTSASKSDEMAGQIRAFKEALGATGEGPEERMFKQLRIRYVQYDQFGIPVVVSRSGTEESGERGRLSDLEDLEKELMNARKEDEAVCKGMILGAVV